MYRKFDFSILVANSITSMLAYWDKDQVCRFANKAYLDWFGKSPEEMIGKMTLKDLLGPIYEKNLPFINAAYAGQFQQFEREIPTPRGDIRHSIATYTPHIVDETVYGIIVNVTDITTIKNLQKELEVEKARVESMATHDFLTDLPNRRYLNSYGNKLLSLHKRQNRLAAVCLLDLDGFKQINDVLGHDFGDRVLKDVGEILKANTRDGDICSRLGGDEFAIVLASIDSRASCNLVFNRVRESIPRIQDIDKSASTLGISMGVALFPADGNDLAELLKAADSALYQSKRAGKNTLRFANE